LSRRKGRGGIIGENQQILNISAFFCGRSEEVDKYFAHCILQNNILQSILYVQFIIFYAVFKNRIKEIKLLENLRKGKKPKLILMYGKRRVGKTEILNEFSKRHKALYLVARQESESDQLKKISMEVAEFFGDPVIEKNPFQNYDALFLYLARKETPILFDEFPYLVESNKALPSALQEHWDKYFSKKHSFIILCGSSIRMMEYLLGYKSPLYGRRTEQMLIDPLSFKDACQFFPKKLSKEQKVIFYGILGGTPAYLLEFDYHKSVKENITETVLQKNKFLYQDTLFVMREELDEPRNYYSIIQSISKGNTEIGNIVNDTGLEKGKVVKYLSVLAELQLTERRVPITEKNPARSRKGIYLLKDNYFKFWFRFVFGNAGYVEQNKQSKLYKEKIAPELNSFIGFAFEEIALDWLRNEEQFQDYIFGRWWDKGEEIDVIGVDKGGNKIIFGEVKWKSLNYRQAVEIVNRLKKKSEKVLWGKNPKRQFILIAKKVEEKNKLLKQDCLVFDLNDLV